MTHTAPRPDAVLLDYNGTLADDEQIVYNVVKSIHADYFSHDLSAAEYFDRLVGRSDDDLLADAMSRYPHVATTTQRSLRAELKKRYEFATRTVDVITAETQRVVRALAAAGVRLGVVTGAQRTQVLPMLTSAGLTSLFETMVTLDDVDHGKPAPDGYLLALHRMGMSPAHSILAVEDSVVGLQAAREAGLQTIAVTGSQPPESLAVHADYMITRLDTSLLDLTPFRGLATPADAFG